MSKWSKGDTHVVVVGVPVAVIVFIFAYLAKVPTFLAGAIACLFAILFAFITWKKECFVEEKKQ